MLKIIAILVAVAGATIDWKTHKIPNKLTVNAVLVGLILNLLFGGLGGLGRSFLGALVGFSFILLWQLGALKAGDVKLYMAIGAIGGWRFGLNTMIFSILIGGVMAFGVMLTRKSGRKSLKNLWNYAVNMFLMRKFHMYESDELAYFCFGICIAAGAVAAMILPGIV